MSAFIHALATLPVVVVALQPPRPDLRASELLQCRFGYIFTMRQCGPLTQFNHNLRMPLDECGFWPAPWDNAGRQGAITMGANLG
jgi:hypothetical protein